jgi:hypothetical protein
LALLLTLGSLAAFGQSPDCQFTQTFTATGYGVTVSNQAVANLGTQCTTWRLSYYADGMTALSIQIEGAPDSSGTPGTFAAVPTTACSSTVQPPCTLDGANPLTDPNHATEAFRGYYAWMALDVTIFTPTGVSGTITARMYGYKGTSPAASNRGGGGSGIAACSTTPPTAGTAGQTCYDTAGLLWVCDPSAPCTVFANWVAQGFANPMNTLGDMISGDTGGTAKRVAGNTSTVPKFLSQTGDGVNSADPSWQPAPAAGLLTYYMTTTASLLTNGSAIVNQDNKMLTPPFSPKTAIDIANNAAADVILQSFATDPGFPGITFIPAGVYIWHIHAYRLSGNRAVTLYAVFREVSATGVAVGTIGTQTESTTALGAAEDEYSLAMADGNTYSLAALTSRIVIDVHAVFTGGSTNTTVRMYVGGTADSHISLPSNTVDSTSFVPYTGATANVALGLWGITGAPFTGDSGSGGTTGLVPAPATGDAAAGKYLGAGGSWSAPTSTGVPYSGATGSVALGAHGITGAAFTGDSGSGGTTGLVPAPATGDTAAGKYLGAGATWSVPTGTGVPYSGATGSVALGAHGITGASFTGDSGSGGTTGLVPAPATGDAAAGKYLGAGATWSVPTGTGITALTGDVTASGSGSVAATIATAHVAPAMMKASTIDSQVDSGTVTWAIASVLNAQATLTFTVHSGSRTLNITNPVIGGNYVLKLIQDGTGGEGLILGTGCTWKVVNGGAGAVTLTNAPNALDVLTFIYDGTNCLTTLLFNLS